jgi:signal transduction histidine kinase
MTKILVIDDQDNLRDEIADWFIFEGFETFSASSGKEGIEIAMKKLPDLILCDVMMPGMDGREVLDHLRKSPATRTIPFIFITALSERRNIRTGMDQGADDYITKPFTREELLRAVNTRISKTTFISEQTRLEMNELRNNLTSNLPHELRTPLNGILGFGQVLMDMPEKFSVEEIREIGNTIYISARRLYRLVNNYQTYARLEMNKDLQPEIEEPATCGKTCELAARTMSKTYNRETDLDLIINSEMANIKVADFRQLADEIIDNAFKFSKPGTRVRVCCENHQNMFIMTVTDEGRGFRAEDIAKVGAYMQFERHTYEQQGSGFGLVLAKKITAFYKGSLDIESEHGKGATVVVKIPC